MGVSRWQRGALKKLRVSNSETADANVDLHFNLFHVALLISERTQEEQPEPLRRSSARESNPEPEESRSPGRYNMIHNIQNETVNSI